MAAHEILTARSRQHHWAGTGALSIKTFVNGEAYYEVGAGRYLVDEQHYLVLNQDQEYTVTVAALAPIEAFCLFFAPGFAEEVHYSATTPVSCLLDNPVAPAHAPLQFFEKTYPHDEILSPHLTHLRSWHPLRQTERSWVQEQMHTIMQRLLTVHQGTQREMEALPALRMATREELYRRLHCTRDYIAASYSQSLTLEMMASVACLSPNHFLRTFKQLFHQTPHQYLTQQRLHHAQKLLRTTEQSVTTICLAVGFESVSSFSWLFRRQIGCSPEQFRRAKR